MNRLFHYYKNLRRRGLWGTFWRFYSYFVLPVSKKMFSYNGAKYPYFINRYSFTWTNERSIEIPIFKMILDNALLKKHSVLEIGCVLNHYFENNNQWKVVDKYEKFDGVVNQDIYNYKKGKYDTIISISTMEHVGYDEDGDCTKFEKAFNNIVENLLKNNGEFVFSIPLGYNKSLDQEIFAKKYNLKIDYFHRTAFDAWEISNNKIAIKSQYNYPYESANDIAICYYRKN